MRSLTVFKALIAACGLSLLAPLAVAQTAPAPAAGTVRDEPVLDRNTQRVEHIQHEDAGSRVNEVRVGGETKSITVQPTDPSGTRAGSREAGPGSTGPRVWKLHQF